MRTRKFDQDAVARRWLRKIKKDKKVVETVKKILSIRAQMGLLRDKLSVLSNEIDQSPLVTEESDRWPKFHLPVQDYTVNGEHWWQYGDSDGLDGALKSLARFLMLKEQHGVDA
jgi:hypothetical protein